MCIIIVNKANNILSTTTLQESCDSNPDGFGLMYAVKKNIKTYKTLNSDLFIKYYYMIRKKYPNIDIVLHCRIGTSGSKDLRNVHPFHVSNKLAFCHNGIFSDYSKAGDLSDTQVFNNTLLKKLPDNFIYSNQIKLLLKSYIGSYNKLVFLDNKGKVFIINEAAGNTDKNNNWYSNLSYIPSQVHYVKNILPSDFIQWQHKTNDYLVKFGNFEGSFTSWKDASDYIKTNHPYFKKDITFTKSLKDYYIDDKYYNDLYCQFCGTYLHTSDERLMQTCSHCFQLDNYYR